MNYFKCYSSRLASCLVKNGFKLIDTEPNLKKPWLDVFLFEDTPELRAIVTNYCEKTN